MPPELHMHPDRLHDHARSAAGLAQRLHEALRGAPDDVERQLRAVGMAVSELDELSAVLRAAAVTGSTADADVSAVFMRLRDVLGRP
jgi:hypothetical protein